MGKEMTVLYLFRYSVEPLIFLKQMAVKGIL